LVEYVNFEPSQHAEYSSAKRFSYRQNHTGGDSGVSSYNTVRDRFSTLVNRLNASRQARDRNGRLEVLTATQLTDIHEARLMHTTEVGNSDVPKYQTIGGGDQYSYVFLKPFYDHTNKITIEKLARVGYFIIKFIEMFELSSDIGGQPRFWCVPNIGPLFTDKERSEWVERFENECSIMLRNFKQNGIDALLTPES
jgi:hypothetical protein